MAAVGGGTTRSGLALGIALAMLGCGGDDGESGGGTETDPATTTPSTTMTTPPSTTAPSGPTSATATTAVDTTGGPTSSTAATEDTGPGTGSSESTGGEFTGSVGCRTGRGLPEGETTFELGGEQRRYILYLPSGYTGDDPMPLLFALHPNGSNIGYWDQTEGNQAIRPVVEDEAILVLAEDLTGNWPDDLPTELDYIDYILDEMKTELCVDEARIFSMGFSGGGSFSGVLGCMRDEFRAIAAGGAIIYFDEADCTNAPAAWVTIGIDELTAGREAFRDFWRDTGGCDETTTVVDPPPCVAYDNCNDETPVHYCEHDGDHIWPSFGTAAAWAFLRQF